MREIAGSILFGFGGFAVGAFAFCIIAQAKEDEYKYLPGFFGIMGAAAALYFAASSNLL